MSLSANDMDRARRHVSAVRNFWFHVMTFVFVNAMFVVIDLGSGDGRVLGLDWAFWIILFWGFGVVGHTISVFFGEERVRRVASRGSTKPFVGGAAAPEFHGSSTGEVDTE